MTTAEKTRVSISLAKIFGFTARIDYLENQNDELTIEMEAFSKKCNDLKMERDAAMARVDAVMGDREDLYAEKVKKLDETKAALQGARKALDIMREDQVRLTFEREQAIAAAKIAQENVNCERKECDAAIAEYKMLRAAELQKLLAAYKRAGGPPIGDGVDIISRVCAHLDYLYVQATRTAKETSNV